MKIRSIVSCVAAAPLLMAGALQPVRLQPSSQWIVDYAENSCRLIRTFGEGKDKTVLALESPSPGTMDMLVVGKPLWTSLTEIPAKFLPVEQQPLKGRPAVSSKSGQPAILWPKVPLLPDPVRLRVERDRDEVRAKPGVRPPPIDLDARAAVRAAREAFASATTELEIGTRRNRPVILETGSLGEPIKMFDQCSRDSLRDWGVDPDLEDKIVRPVWAADRSRWFTASDYPPDMLRRFAESEVSARVLVDASGKVTSCTSLSHFDAPEFNKVVCNKLKARAAFEPAELADGTKVPSYYTVRIVFRMAR